MSIRNVLFRMMVVLMVTGMVVLPAGQGGVYAQGDRPEPASPAEGSAPGDVGGRGLAMSFAPGSFQAPFIGGGNRLVSTQNPDGGWGWPLNGGSAPNTVGPIAMGLSQAYRHTGDAAQKAALQNAGAYLLTKTNNFSPSDGYLAAELDQVFGGSAYVTHVMTNFYSPLAAGTYNRNGAGALYDTAGYVNLIRTNRHSSGQGNLAAWDVGMGLVGAAMAGGSTSEWVAGVKAEIEELDGDSPNYWDVIGLAGAVYGLAYVNEDFDPTSGEHAAASNLGDLADILASYQIENGGFAWNKDYVIPDDSNETVQETAYAILALNEVDRAAYLGKIHGAADYLVSVQLSTGGWDNYLGDPDGENNEITGEALWGIAAAGPEMWGKYTGNPVVTGSLALDPYVINEGGVYKMWYTHVDDSEVWAIYYADSSDGINWINKQKVLESSGPGSFDEKRIGGPSVINDGGDYKMWFTARDVNNIETIGYATSTNGIIWNKVGKVLDVGAHGAWDSQMVREPSVILDGGVYKMWYAGAASWPVFKIGLATSLDGINWTKDASNPVFTGTAGGWDGFQVYAPNVVLDGSVYHMYFSGTDNYMSQRWSTGHAVSADGIDWTEAVRNPILIPDGTDDSLDYVSAMNDGGTWKIWYSYGGDYAIGLATLTSETQLWLDPAVASIPNDAVATQTFNVMIANAVDLYGYQFVITFDKANLEATAAAFDNSFFSSALGSPGSWDAFIDNTNGKVYFARSRMNPELPVSGDGPLATVTFKSKSGATAKPYKIDFELDKLGDIEGNALAHSRQYAWLTLYGVGAIQGSVDLQGRSNESGGTVTILTAAGYTASTPISAADGSWSLSNVPVGSYQVNVEMERYLDSQKGASASGVSVTSGGTAILAEVKLLGGDADDSDKVDVSDASIIGGEFGNSGAGIGNRRADINNDDIVDILDLVLMGGNFDKTSPVTWP